MTEKIGSARRKSTSSSDAASEDRSVSKDGLPGRRPGKNRRAAVRKAAVLVFVTLVLGLVTVWGIFVDSSLRPDPFSNFPRLWDRFRYPVPHPAMAEMPVVPIGARGELTFRPEDTSWVNSPMLELSIPAQAGALNGYLLSPIGTASAQSQSEQEAIDSAKGGRADEQATVPEASAGTLALDRIAAPALGGTRILCSLSASRRLLAGRRFWIVSSFTKGGIGSTNRLVCRHSSAVKAERQSVCRRPIARRRFGRPPFAEAP